MDRKFQVHWTGNKEWQEKNPKGPVMNLQEFTTRKAAEEFVKQNKYIYWSSITSSMPRSNWPKVIVSPSEDLSLTHQSITGVLDTYFETGMEGISIIVDPLKQGKSPNPSYDPSKPDSDENFPFYKDLMDMHFINKNDVMEVSGMRYHLVHDRDFLS